MALFIHHLAVGHIGDDFRAVGVGDGLAGIAAAEAFQFGVGGEAVEVGLPVFQTVLALFLYGDHSAVRSLIAE